MLPLALGLYSIEGSNYKKIISKYIKLYLQMAKRICVHPKVRQNVPKNVARIGKVKIIAII